MELKFRIQEVLVHPLEDGDLLDIRIVHDRDDQYIVNKPLKSGGHKTLVRSGAGYEWAYLPFRDVVAGTLEEVKHILMEMYG
jgi:hypothetical protein